MTKILYGFFDSEAEARSYYKAKTVTANGGVPETYICFGEYQGKFRVNKTFYFGMLFTQGFSDKYVNEFNELFKNIKLEIICRAIFHQHKSAMDGTWYDSALTGNNSKEDKEVEHVFIKVTFSKEYKDLPKYYIGCFLGETMRLYCSEWIFGENIKGLEVEKDYFFEAIRVSNARLGKNNYSITAMMGGRIDLEKIMVLDNPEEINKIVIPGIYLGMYHSGFDCPPFPSYLNMIIGPKQTPD